MTERLTAEDVAAWRAAPAAVSPADQLRLLDELDALLGERAAVAGALAKLRRPWVDTRRALNQLYRIAAAG